jgi:Tfp pilus assembly PilM family ATPase
VKIPKKADKETISFDNLKVECIREEEQSDIEFECSTVLRSTMTRIVSEVERGIRTYKAHPEILYLTGGSSSFEGLSNFLSSKLKIPTFVFNPLKNVVVHEDMAQNHGDMEHISRTCSALVGLAYRPYDGERGPLLFNVNPKIKVNKSVFPRMIGWIVKKVEDIIYWI